MKYIIALIFLLLMPLQASMQNEANNLAKQLSIPLSDFHVDGVSTLNKIMLNDNRVIALHVEDAETKKTFIFEYKENEDFFISSTNLSAKYMDDYLNVSANILYLGKKIGILTIFYQDAKEQKIVNSMAKLIGYALNSTSMEDAKSIVESYMQNHSIGAVEIVDDETKEIFFSAHKYGRDVKYTKNSIKPNRAKSLIMYSGDIIYKDKSIGVLKIYFYKNKIDASNSDVVLQTPLTQTEIEYLLEKDELLMCVLPNYLPYSKIDENGNYIGVVADIVKIIQKLIDTKIVINKTKSWSESLQKMKNKKCDILPLVVNTQSRKEHFRFTNKYASQPLVVATTNEKPFIANVKALEHKTVGIVKDYSSIEILVSKYPNIDIVAINSAAEGLQKVSSGELYAYIDALTTIGYYIQKGEYTNLKISGKIDITLDVFMATQLDEPILTGILNKALNSIDEQTKENIYAKWLNIKIKQVIDFSYLKEVILLSIFFALVSLFWIRRLSKTKEELRYKNMEFMSIFNETLNTVAIFENNICIDVNESGVNLLGCDNKEELLGKSLSDFIAPHYHSIVLSKIKSKDSKPYEIMLVKKDMTEFPALLKSFTLSNLDKNVEMISFMDLTDIKEKELSLELARYKAEESTKAKSEFLANMSHEIRTPMNGIIGMSHLVLKTELNDRQKSYMQKIGTSANSLLGVINDILDISKIEAGKLEIYKVDFDMLNLISRVHDVVALKAKQKGLYFEVNYEKNTTNFLHGDDLRISQVIINLLNNAIKFTSKGKVVLNITNIKDRYIFEVIDSGIGISANQQRKLFESFSQLDASRTREYGGSGLGLSISKQLVELMDGKIWVESRLHIGTKFSFEIKIQKSKNSFKRVKKQYTAKDISVLSGSKILLVEDNLINQEIIFGFLENTGIEIDTVNNGQEAVDLFKVNRKKYELILMDIQMPIMDGYEATKLIQNMNDTIPIVALSANAMNEDVQKSKSLGMKEHLTKPIEVEKLYKTLLDYISKKVDELEFLTDNDDVVIPEFKTINTKLGLIHLADNKKLYMKILVNFYEDYHDFKIDNLEKMKFKIATHTMKSLSANIGATSLHEIAKKLDTTQDKSYLSEFYIELSAVMSELKLIKLDEKILNEEKEEVSYVKIEKLMIELNDAIKSHRPKNCELVLQELDKYRLSSKDLELFEHVKKFVENYKFSEAAELMKGV